MTNPFYRYSPQHLPPPFQPMFFGLPTPFQLPYRPGSNPLPTMGVPTPHTPHRVGRPPLGRAATNLVASRKANATVPAIPALSLRVLPAESPCGDAEPRHIAL